MSHLYRSSTYLQHWFAFTPATGWVIFPAKMNGWDDRRKAGNLDRVQLTEVPLWMAFGTGLCEETESAQLCSAA
jgi:hypothetical protein